MYKDFSTISFIFRAGSSFLKGVTFTAILKSHKSKPSRGRLLVKPPSIWSKPFILIGLNAIGTVAEAQTGRSKSPFRKYAGMPRLILVAQTVTGIFSPSKDACGINSLNILAVLSSFKKPFLEGENEMYFQILLSTISSKILCGV
jgi:hypothetical protein